LIALTAVAGYPSEQLRLKTSVRKSDLSVRHVTNCSVSRLGDDEFVILLQSISCAQAVEQVAAKILNATGWQGRIVQGSDLGRKTELPN